MTSTSGDIRRGRLRATAWLFPAVAGVLAFACGAGCPGVSPCDVPGVICTVAGTGHSQFDGDGRAATQTSLYHPIDVDFDREGRPLILDFNNLRVRRINEGGIVETYMGLDYEAAPVAGSLASETPLHHASDLATDAEGRLYVAGDHIPMIFRVNLEDRVEIVAGTGDFGSDGDGASALAARLTTPFGVLPDGEGGCYIGDAGVHVIRHVSDTGIISTIAGDGTKGFAGDGGPATNAKLNGPTRMCFGADGLLYICDTENHAIRRLEEDGTINTVAGDGTAGYSGDGGPAAAARLSRPYDIETGPDGALYVADSGNNVIRRIDGSGIITTFIGTGVAGYAGDEGDAAACELDGPSGLKFASDGSLWISDTLNHRIRRVADAMALLEG